MLFIEWSLNIPNLHGRKVKVKVLMSIKSFLVDCHHAKNEPNSSNLNMENDDARPFTGVETETKTINLSRR